MDYYPKMMTGMLRHHMKLQDHEPIPSQHQKHLERCKAMWLKIETVGADEQVRMMGAMVYECLHWIAPHLRENFINNLSQAIGHAVQGVMDEEARKGPTLYIPPGAKLS